MHVLSPFLSPLSSCPATLPACSKLKISVGPAIQRVTERGKVDFLHKRNPVFDERWGWSRFSVATACTMQQPACSAMQHAALLRVVCSVV